MVRAGERAIVAHRPARVCALLTRRARRNSLIAYSAYYKTNFAGEGNPEGRPRPHTCRKAIDDLLDFERMDGTSKAEIREAMRPTKVVRIRGRRAHVRVGQGTEIYLRKTSHGWRADYANFAPFDGSTGY